MNELVEATAIVLGIAGVTGAVVSAFNKNNMDKLQKENKQLKEKIGKKVDDIHGLAEVFTLMIQPLNHKFFSDIIYYLSNESWCCGLNSVCDTSDEKCNNAKRKITNNMLKIKLFIWYCGYMKLFKSEKEDCDFTLELINSTLRDIINIYQKKWETEVKIPIYIVNRFNEKHNSRAFYISEKMEEHFRDPEESTNVDFLKNKFLDYSHVLLKDTISDISHIMKDIKLKEQDLDYSISYTNPVRDKTKEEICDLCTKEYSR
ncbi:hypothetical protein GMJAKD_13110 [Candidatus Electrothrix aarhusensis]